IREVSPVGAGAARRPDRYEQDDASAVDIGGGGMYNDTRVGYLSTSTGAHDMQADSTTSARQQVSLAIAGMSCGHCVAAVTEALDALDGVQVQRVALGAATVELDPRVSSTSAVVEAVRAAGY